MKSKDGTLKGTVNANSDRKSGKNTQHDYIVVSLLQMFSYHSATNYF